VRRVTRRAARRLLVGAIALLGGCASPGAPPGGPPDAEPPRVLGTTPASLGTNVRPRAVVFQFDEVVSEVPRNGTDLSALVLVSPRSGSPDVDWNRRAIAVRAGRGWRANTTYTVTLLPGLVDLRGNARDSATVVVFSTGAAIAGSRVTGAVFDWVSGSPAPRALVEAIAADSTVYLAQSDSSGRFSLRNIPPGSYTVRGILDQNNNRALDPRELFDSVMVTVADSAAVELLAFVHDTIGPRIQTVTVRDSLTLRVQFDKPILPAQAIDTSIFTLLGPDSARVRIAVAQRAALFDSLDAVRQRAVSDSMQRAAAARDTTTPPRPPTPPVPAPPAAVVDTARARADSARRPPRPSRPSPTSEVVIRLAAPLPASTSFTLQATGVRGLTGAARTSERTFSTPKPPPVPAARADSAPPTVPPTRPPAAPPTTPTTTTGTPAAPARVPRDAASTR
jgi:hypothetical protein